MPVERGDESNSELERRDLNSGEKNLPALKSDEVKNAALRKLKKTLKGHRYVSHINTNSSLGKRTEGRERSRGARRKGEGVGQN